MLRQETDLTTETVPSPGDNQSIITFVVSNYVLLYRLFWLIASIGIVIVDYLECEEQPTSTQ